MCHQPVQALCVIVTSDVAYLSGRQPHVYRRLQKACVFGRRQLIEPIEADGTVEVERVENPVSDRLQQVDPAEPVQLR